MRGLLRISTSHVIRSGFTGFSPFRSFSEYRALLTPSFDAPRSMQEMLALVRHELESARRGGFLTPPPGRLHVLVGGEFRFHRRTRASRTPGASSAHVAQGPESDGYTYDARERIPKDWFTAAVIEAQRILRTAPPGVVYCMGTAALAIGSHGGRELGENRGALISSGPDADVLEFTKNDPRPLDGWHEALTVLEGGRTTVVPVADVVGGDHASYLAMSVSIDYEADLAAGKVHFPIRPHLILIPSATWPRRLVPETIEVLLHDPTSDLLEGGGSLKTRPWDSPRGSIASGAIVAIVDRAYAIGTPLFTAVHALLLRSSWRDWVTPQRELSPLPYDVIPFGAESAVDTGVRPLPAEMSEATLSARARAIVEDGGTALSHGMGNDELAGHIAVVKALGKDLATEPLMTAIAGAIDDEVNRQIAAGFDLGGAVPALVDRVDADAVRAAVVATAMKAGLAAAVGKPGYQALVDRVGFTVAEGLMTVGYAEALLRRMLAGPPGETYLHAAIAANLYAARARRMTERAAEIRSDIARASEEAPAVSAAFDVATRAVEEAKQALARSHDPSGEPRRAALEEEVRRLEADIARRGEDMARRERELAAVEAATGDAVREERASRQRRDARSADVFRFDP